MKSSQVRKFSVLFAALFMIVPKEARCESAPFKLDVSTSKAVVSDGGEVRVTISLKNTSTHAIYISKTAGGAQLQYRIEVTDESGKPVAETALGRGLKGPMFSSDVVFTLRPGETISDEVSVSKLFQFIRPGEYVIQVFREVPGRADGKMVKSNALKIRIAK